MKKIITFMIIAISVFGLAACSQSKTACKAKGYKTWYCGYERPQSSYRAMLR